MINQLGIANGRWSENGFICQDKCLMVHSCGFQKFISRDFEKSRPNGRADYQFIYLIKGKGYYTFNNKSVTVEAGNMICFLPNQPQYYRYTCHDQTELYWIHFTGSSIKEILSSIHVEQNIIANIGVQKALCDLFDETIKELQMQRSAFQTQSNAYFLQLIAFIERHQAKKQNALYSHVNEDIGHIIHLMHLDYRKQWSLPLLAQTANLSVYHFAHKFKENTGLTPIQYLTRIRINNAMDLLSSTLMPIKEVAILSGYSNSLYFSRVFHQSIGLSPSVYRHNARKNTENTTDYE